MERQTGIVFKRPGSGGAARYVGALARWFDAPVHVLGETGDDVPNTWGDVTVEAFGRRPSLPLIGRRGVGAFLDRLEYAFWRPPADHDVVISSGLVAKETVHRPGQTRIHLAHGFHRGAFGVPVRDGTSDRATVAALQRANRLLLRALEPRALDRVDVLVANSPFTADMIAHYHGIEADAVIAPPVAVDDFEVGDSGGPYLYLGNLAPYKGVRDIVEAFADLPHELVVAGDGPLRDEIEALAGDGVTVEGYVSEDRKRELLRDSSGLIQHSVNETFGVTTVEAFASGTPVIAIDRENNPHLVDDGVNGVLFDRRGPDAIRAAVERAETVDWDPRAIAETAAPYDADSCETRWRSLLDDAASPRR